jgi:lysophospholipase
VSDAFETRGLQAPDARFLRACIWHLPPGVARRGVCVLLGGHSEFAEKYGEVAGELNARGFTVATVDWRGQGASERLARGNYKSHVTNFAEYELDVVTLMKQVVDPLLREQGRVPVIALAHSMGGHILLRFLHEYPGPIAAAVLCAPMMTINFGGVPPWLVRIVVRLANLRKGSQRFIPGASTHDPLDIPFEKNRLTSDRGRYERTLAILRKEPYLRVFGPTFGWLKAAIASVALVNRRSYARDIETPVLIIGAGNDRIVPTSGTRQFVKLLPDAAYIEIANSEHEVLMENDAIRAQFWTAFDAFVNERLESAKA